MLRHLHEIQAHRLDTMLHEFKYEELYKLEVNMKYQTRHKNITSINVEKKLNEP